VYALIVLGGVDVFAPSAKTRQHDFVSFRVADASLMLAIPCRNILSATIAIAERGRPQFRRHWLAERRKLEADVIKSRNVDVAAVAVSAVEGKPMYGGNMLVKPLIKGDEMTFLEIHYAAGVGAPLHIHSHESIAYVVKGKVKSTVGSEEFIMGPGDVCRHPKGVLHGLEAIEDSVVVEIKSPAPEISAFFTTRT
jgi:quercetin dioxygenase-like cupin family protein